MLTNLKVGIVTPFPPSKTTLNEYGFHLVRHFKEKPEIQVTQLYVEDLPEGEAYEDESGLEFIPCWRFNSYGNLFSILSQVRKHKPDIVLFNIQFLSFGDKKVAAALGLMLPMVLRVFGFKSIVLLHNILEEVDLEEAGITKNPILKFIFNTIGNLLTRFILSANLVGVTIEKYVDILSKKYNKKNVVLLPHGTFEIPPTPDYTLPEGAMKVMTFGKFGTYKKVEILIEALEIVRKRSSLDLELVVAGTDNPNVKGYLQGVRETYQEVSGITFTGYVDEEDVPRIFQESAVTVFPYTSTTGSSGVLHQAGSYGKAAILPNLGDLGRLIEEEGYRGVYFEPGDEKSLADAIEQVLSKPEYRKELEKANFRAASSLSMSDITDWYLIHMNKLLT